MSTSILIPLDDSRWSQCAADLAIWIAQRAANPSRQVNTAPLRGAGGVNLVGLHVVNVTQVRGRLLEDLAGMLGFEPVVVPDQVEAHFMKLGQERLGRFEARCQEADVPCRTVLDQGNVVERIIHHGGRHDFVIMGVRGETEERFPGQGGGTAERVLRRAGTSTIVVPQHQVSIEGIVLGYDGSAGSARALRAVARLGELIQVPVRAIHVIGTKDSDRVDLDDVIRRLNPLGIPVTTGKVRGEPQEVLPAEAMRLGYDLLAMGYRGRSRIKDIFLGRTTEWLVGHVAMGMLVAR